MAIRETLTGNQSDELIGGTGITLLTANVTIASGSNTAGNPLKRGTVLGKITAGNRYCMTDKSKTDGSQVADRILAFDVDAAAADVVATTYVAGIFNREKLIFASGDGPENHEEELRDKNIYLTKII